MRSPRGRQRGCQRGRRQACAHDWIIMAKRARANKGYPEKTLTQKLNRVLHCKPSWHPRFLLPKQNKRARSNGDAWLPLDWPPLQKSNGPIPLFSPLWAWTFLMFPSTSGAELAAFRLKGTGVHVEPGLQIVQSRSNLQISQASRVECGIDCS